MLVCEKLSYKRGKKELLKEISLSFEPGKIYALLGPNGSGKSTLLKCLAGLLEGSSGQVTWKGNPLSSMTRKEIAKTLSLLAPSFPTTFDFTAGEIVSMGRFAHSTSSKETSLSCHYLSEVGALIFKDRLFSTLSSGEKQRVLIARSLATEAPFLLLDEPASALDPGHEQLLWELLTTLKSKGKTLIASLHHLELAKPYLDHALFLKHGALLAHGPATELLTPELLHKLYGN